MSIFVVVTAWIENGCGRTALTMENVPFALSVWRDIWMMISWRVLSNHKIKQIFMPTSNPRSPGRYGKSMCTDTDVRLEARASVKCLAKSPFWSAIINFAYEYDLCITNNVRSKIKGHFFFLQVFFFSQALSHFSHVMDLRFAYSFATPLWKKNGIRAIISTVSIVVLMFFRLIQSNKMDTNKIASPEAWSDRLQTLIMSRWPRHERWKSLMDW